MHIFCEAEIEDKTFLANSFAINQEEMKNSEYRFSTVTVRYAHMILARPLALYGRPQPLLHLSLDKQNVSPTSVVSAEVFDHF